MPGAVTPFRRLKERNHGTPTDRVFPSLQRELFNDILRELDLRLDPDQVARLELPAGVYVNEIAVAPSDPTRIYVATWGDYIYRSLDHGATWEKRSAGLSGGWSGPSFITALAVWYAATAMLPDLLMRGVAPEQLQGRWLGRISMILIFLVAVLLIRTAFMRRSSATPASDADTMGVAR